jgi:predicted metal-dependent hydrolase
MADSAKLRQLGLFEAPEPGPGWEVRESARARRLTVKVFPGGRVQVVVPRGTRAAVVQQFVARHARWIDRKVEEYRHQQPPSPQPLPDEIRFQALGECWNVAYEPGRAALRATEGDWRLLVRGDLQRPRAIRHMLQRWLLRHAHARLSPWLEATAAATGTAYRRLQVRRQRTRWGSCSRSGTISLNACLLFQPAPVARYLFVHELAHTQQMNHSSRFWRLVEDFEPDWRGLDRDLMRGWRHVPDWVFG